jgi:hypothetical protein
MRVLAAILTVGLSIAAGAQEPTPGPPPLPPPNSTLTVPVGPLGPPPLTMGATPTADVVSSWQSARIVSVIGTLFSVVGTGLSLASVIYIAATHYPPSAVDLLTPPVPSDPGPAMAYAGASASAAGFVMSAAGLGYEHHLLDRMGVDPGRGRFAIGTSIGVLGFTSVGISYFFGFTHYLNPHDREVAILATSIGGAALCAIAGLVYVFDSSRNKAVWKRLGVVMTAGRR